MRLNKCTSNFEDILRWKPKPRLLFVFNPDEGGDPKWKKEVIDPQIDNLVRRMREGHEFKATDFRGGDSSLPPLKPAEKAEGVGVKRSVKSRLIGLKAVMNLKFDSARPFDCRGYVNKAEPKLIEASKSWKEWIMKLN
ncbi:hypothetical protein Bca52824_004536 [Brassica carinata]|uniref:Uncharacterized protein n=1 Tax=Brassica carinata TaxID=52824 RepID=A0A8X7WP66_BRACI|nr:hypothetical protein Bca52824_004536 [Brassica carinata]